MRIGRKFAVGLLYGLGACAVVVAVSIGMDVWRSGALFSGLAPLRMRFADMRGSEQSSPFTAAWSASHEVSLVFPTPVKAPPLRQAVESAAHSVGANSPYPAFDFEWQVLEGSKPVGLGSGRNRPTSVSRVPGIVALGFGTFQAEAGHAYVLRTSFGPESNQYRSAMMEVHVAVGEPAPGIELAWVRDLGLGTPWACGGEPPAPTGHVHQLRLMRVTVSGSLTPNGAARRIVPARAGGKGGDSRTRSTNLAREVASPERTLCPCSNVAIERQRSQMGH